AKELETLCKKLDAETLRNVELRNRAKNLSEDLDIQKSLYETAAAAARGARAAGSGGSTLQEDLLELIGPDYLDSDCEDPPWCLQGAPERPHSGAPSSRPRCLWSAWAVGRAWLCAGGSSCPSLAEDFILTTAQPAQVIACPDASPPPSGDRGPHLQDKKPQPQRPLHDLEERVVKLQETLAQEQHHKANLEHQVRQLRQETHRLHEQSQSASAQLKSLTPTLKPPPSHPTPTTGTMPPCLRDKFIEAVEKSRHELADKFEDALFCSPLDSFGKAPAVR
ncbi:hypothetical protein HPB47_027139, partial [Ixodes persulcatus]